MLFCNCKPSFLLKNCFSVHSAYNAGVLYFLLFYMKRLSQIALASVAASASLSQAFATINFGQSNVQTGLQGSTNTADSAIQNLIQNALTFLGILAVCYALYGGFLMLTAGEDDGKVKKGKTVIINAALGIVVIVLSYSIVGFIFKIVSGV